MKRKKTLLILVCVLAALCVGILIAKKVEQHVDDIATVDEEVFSVSEDDLTEVTWTTEDTTLDFTKEEDTWKDASDEAFPVDQEEISNFLAYFASVHASFIIDDVEDYSQYGLDDPEGTITFTTADETTTISFGTFSTMDSKRYISVGTESVYLIDDDLMEYLSTNRDDFMQQDSLPNYQQVTAFDMEGENNLSVFWETEASYTYTDQYPYYLKDGEKNLALSEDYTESLFGELTGFSFTDYATYTASEESLDEYGLAEPALTITMSGDVASEENDAAETQSATITIGHVDDENNYLRVGDSEIIYRLDADTYQDLLDASYETLRPSEVILADWTAVNEIVTTADGETDTILVNHSKKTDEDDTYTLEDQDINFSAVISDIDGLTLSEAGSDYEKGVEELSLVLKQDDETYPELTVTLYRYDGDSCVAEMNGEVVGLISRDQMTGLRDDITSAVLNIGKEEES